MKDYQHDHLLRIREVLSIIPVSRSTLYNWIAAGYFPPGVKLGPRAIAWRYSDVQRFVAEGAICS